MTRRTFLASAALAQGFAAPRSAFGVATTCYMTVRRPKDTIEFLEYTSTLGAAGIQASLASLEPAYLKKLRARAEQLGMYIEVMSGLPRQPNMEQFVKTLEGAKAAGAVCVRAACLGGRRYETFATLEEWTKFVSDSRAAVARAVPVCEKLRMPLALENHKDWTVDEMTALLKHYSSEHLGCCLDTGNNIALLDDPYEVVERLAPYAISTHIKDMAVDAAPGGFLLSEVPLGTGMLKIRELMATIAKARPKTRMTLEMITRNPLYIPCLTDKFWATFPDRNGRYLARSLRMVAEKKTKLPILDGLDQAAQLKTEDDNVRKCLGFPA